jgi:hypothetical protein
MEQLHAREWLRSKDFGEPDDSTFEHNFLGPLCHIYFVLPYFGTNTTLCSA